MDPAKGAALTAQAKRQREKSDLLVKLVAERIARCRDRAS